MVQCHRNFRTRHVDFGLVAVIEVGVQLVIFLLRDIVVLVVVAAGAADGQSQPHRAQCLRAVHHGEDAPLFLVRAPFRIGQRLPVERGG